MQLVPHFLLQIFLLDDGSKLFIFLIIFAVIFLPLVKLYFGKLDGFLAFRRGAGVGSVRETCRKLSDRLGKSLSLDKHSQTSLPPHDHVPNSICYYGRKIALSKSLFNRKSVCIEKIFPQFSRSTMAATHDNDF